MGSEVLRSESLGVRIGPHEGWLSTDKHGNRNLYRPAITEKSAVRSRIERFLEEVVGSDPEHVELLEEILAARERRRRTDP